MKKLRNKKTGVIGELHYYPDKEYAFTVSAKDPLQMGIYKTLGTVLKDWTDFIVHEPAEPLIKDEKIRKAVRAWAEANGFGATDPLRYTLTEELEVVSFDNGTNFIKIMFCGFPDGIKGLYHLKWYTIAELCEKEEE